MPTPRATMRAPMGSEPVRAYCPKCTKEYDFYVDPQVSDKIRLFPAPRRMSKGRLVRRCFACSFRKSRWDWVWIPALIVIVAAGPLTWVVWWAILGHFLLFAAIVYIMWRGYRRRSEQAEQQPDASTPPVP